MDSLLSHTQNMTDNEKDTFILYVYDNDCLHMYCPVNLLSQLDYMKRLLTLIVDGIRREKKHK